MRCACSVSLEPLFQPNDTDSGAASLGTGATHPAREAQPKAATPCIAWHAAPSLTGAGTELGQVNAPPAARHASTYRLLTAASRIPFKPKANQGGHTQSSSQAHERYAVNKKSSHKATPILIILPTRRGHETRNWVKKRLQRDRVSS